MDSEMEYKPVDIPSAHQQERDAGGKSRHKPALSRSNLHAAVQLGQPVVSHLAEVPLTDNGEVVEKRKKKVKSKTKGGGDANSKQGKLLAEAGSKARNMKPRKKSSKKSISTTKGMQSSRTQRAVSDASTVASVSSVQIVGKVVNIGDVSVAFPDEPESEFKAEDDVEENTVAQDDLKLPHRESIEDESHEEPEKSQDESSVSESDNEEVMFSDSDSTAIDTFVDENTLPVDDNQESVEEVKVSDDEDSNELVENNCDQDGKQRNNSIRSDELGGGDADEQIMNHIEIDLDMNPNNDGTPNNNMEFDDDNSSIIELPSNEESDDDEGSVVENGRSSDDDQDDVEDSASMCEAMLDVPDICEADLDEPDRPANEADAGELAEEDLVELRQLSGSFASPFDLVDAMFAEEDRNAEVDAERLFAELMSLDGSFSSNSDTNSRSSRTNTRSRRKGTRGWSFSSNTSTTPTSSVANAPPHHRRVRSLRPKLAHAHSMGQKMFKTMLTSKRSFRESFSKISTLFPTRSDSDATLESVMDMYPNRSSVVEYSLDEGDEYSYEVEYGTCPICIEDVDTRSIVTIAGCSHKFCSECFHTHLKFEIFAGRSTEMRCPYPGCKIQLKQAFLQEVLSEADYAQLDTWEMQYKVEHNPTLFACITPACETVFTWDGDRPLGHSDREEVDRYYGEGCPMHANCGACEVDFCLNCHEKPFHTGIPCKPGAGPQRQNRGSMDDLTRDFLSQNVAICPNCGIGIDRRNSSTLMQCLCGYQFCLSCGSRNADCDCAVRHYYKRNLARLRARQQAQKEAGLGCLPFNWFAIWRTKMIGKIFGISLEDDENDNFFLSHSRNHSHNRHRSSRHGSRSQSVHRHHRSHSRHHSVSTRSRSGTARSRSGTARSRSGTTRSRSGTTRSRSGTSRSRSGTTRSRSGTGAGSDTRYRKRTQTRATRGESSFVAIALPSDDNEPGNNEVDEQTAAILRVVDDAERLRNLAKRRQLYKNRSKGRMTNSEPNVTENVSDQVTAKGAALEQLVPSKE